MTSDNYMIKMIDDFIDRKNDPGKGRLEDTDLFKYFYSGRDKCRSYVRIESLFAGKNSVKKISVELREMLASNNRFKFAFFHSDKYKNLDFEFWEWFRNKLNRDDYKGENGISGNETFSLRKRQAGMLSVLIYGRHNITEKELVSFLSANRSLLKVVCEDAAIIEVSYDAAMHKDKYERAGRGKASRIADCINAVSGKRPEKKDAQALWESLNNSGVNVDSTEGLIINLESAEHTLTSMVIIDNCFIKSDGRRDIRNDFTDPMARFHYAIFNAGYVTRNGTFGEAFYIPDNSSYDRTLDEFRQITNQALADLSDFDSIKAVRKSMDHNRPECFSGFLDEPSETGYGLPEVYGTAKRGRYTDSGAAFDELV